MRAAVGTFISNTESPRSSIPANGAGFLEESREKEKEGCSAGVSGQLVAESGAQRVGGSAKRPDQPPASDQPVGWHNGPACRYRDLGQQQKRARAPFFLVIFFRSVVVLVNRIEKRRAPPASARQLLLLLLLSTAPTKSERTGDNGRAAVTFPYQYTTPEFVRRRKSRGRPLRPRAS